MEFDEVRVNRGKYLYEEGDPVDGFYLRVNGDFEVSKVITGKSNNNQSQIKQSKKLNLPQRIMLKSDASCSNTIFCLLSLGMCGDA